MAIRLLSCFVVLASVCAEKPRILPTDIISGTWDALYDLDMAVLDHVDQLATKHDVYTKAQELLDQACTKIPCPKKSEVMDKWSMVQQQMTAIKAQLIDLKEKAKAPLDDIAATLVDKFEKFAPSYKGAAPKTFVDLALISLYLLVVSYVILRIAFFALRICLAIFCCFCCCGCCRGGKKSGSKNAKHAQKRAAAAAAEKGKAADSKASAKAQGKKK
jgi:ABC-type protease/lipase transport system fused ATPase/permease subunit